MRGRPTHHQRTWPTLGASMLMLSFFGLAIHQFTGGFTHWTLEEARRAQVNTERLRAPALPLRTHTGTTLTAWGKAQPVGAVQVIDFIYTRCPTVCLSLGTAFQRMQADLADNPVRHGAIRLWSLSFDPAHDTQAELAAYARRHHADPRTWTMAAPLAPEGMARIRQHWGVVAIADGAGGYVHNGSIHVVDARGTVRGIYDHGDWASALQRARALADSGS